MKKKRVRSRGVGRFLVAGLLISGGVVGTATVSQAQTMRFAIIGDYGTDDANQLSVANRLKSYSPEFITTVGDNNYLTGSVADWDRTQGKYYGQYIKYPAGSTSAFAGNGVTVNNFFPVLGNHDWDAGVSTYTNYFELPTSASGGERYYTFTRGSVQFFMVDSDPREPNGVTASSTQAAWLESAMRASTAPFKIVQFHHPAHTSNSNHTASLNMRWDFAAWGASAVLAGHNHFYERLNVNGLPYFVNGSGGRSLYTASSADPNRQFFNGTDYGFLLVEADNRAMTFRFITAGGATLDTLTINAAAVAPEPGTFSLLAFGAFCVTVAMRKRIAK